MWSPSSRVHVPKVPLWEDRSPPPGTHLPWARRLFRIQAPNAWVSRRQKIGEPCQSIHLPPRGSPPLPTSDTTDRFRLFPSSACTAAHHNPARCLVYSSPLLSGSAVGFPHPSAWA